MAVSPITPTTNLATSTQPVPETPPNGGFAAILSRAFNSLTGQSASASASNSAASATDPSSAPDGRTKLDQLLTNLHKLIRDRLSRRGMDPQQPFQLSIDRRARVSIEGEHVDRDRLADIFQGDPEISSVLGQIVALNAASRADGGAVGRILPTQLSYAPSGVTLLAAQDR